MPIGNQKQILEEISTKINDMFCLIDYNNHKKSKSPPNNYYKVNILHGKTSNKFYQRTRVTINNNNNNNTSLIKSRYHNIKIQYKNDAYKTR